MLCERCGVKQAVVHMTKMEEGKPAELHLCQECAQKAQINAPISFQDIFQGLIQLAGAISMADAEKAEHNDNKKCLECGLTWEGFRKTGRLGCPKCYETYEDKINTMLCSIHGSKVHKGKIPKRNGSVLLLRKEIEELRLRLKKAVTAEEFEEAARLRDKIRELEKGGLL